MTLWVRCAVMAGIGLMTACSAGEEPASAPMAELGHEEALDAGSSSDVEAEPAPSEHDLLLAGLDDALAENVETVDCWSDILDFGVGADFAFRAERVVVGERYVVEDDPWVGSTSVRRDLELVDAVIWWPDDEDLGAMTTVASIEAVVLRDGAAARHSLLDYTEVAVMRDVYVSVALTPETGGALVGVLAGQIDGATVTGTPCSDAIGSSADQLAEAMGFDSGSAALAAWGQARGSAGEARFVETAENLGLLGG